MPPPTQDKHEQNLEQFALAAVREYNANRSFAPEKHYTIQLPTGELRRLHGGGRADVYLLNYQNKRYCLKWFHDSRLISRFRNALNLSKAKQSYAISQKLQQLRINAPKIIGVIQPSRFGSPLLIMEMLDGCQQLNLMLEEWKNHTADLCDYPSFLQLAKQFGTFTRKLHQNGVLHRDFSPRNVLVQHQRNIFEFYLIDLEDVYFGTDSSDNIAHFNDRLPRYLSPAECCVFLTHFQAAYKQTAP